MSDAGQAFNAGHTITVGGTPYTIGVLTTSSQAKLEAWAKSKVREDAFAMLGPDAPPSVRADMVRWCFSDEARRGIAQQMDSFEGIAKRLELSLRQNHPDVTEAEVTAVLDAFGFKELLALLDALMEDLSATESAERQIINAMDALGAEKVRELLDEWEKEGAKDKAPLSPPVGKPS